MGKAENNAAFEFDNAAFEFDNAAFEFDNAAFGYAQAASSMRWFRLRSTTETRVVASSRGLSVAEAPDYSEAGYLSVVERSRILIGG